jgi:hypothetical protein
MNDVGLTAIAVSIAVALAAIVGLIVAWVVLIRDR